METATRQPLANAYPIKHVVHDEWRFHVSTATDRRLYRLVNAIGRTGKSNNAR